MATKKEKVVEKVEKKFNVNQILIVFKLNGIDAIHLCKVFNKQYFATKEEWKTLIIGEGIIINE